MNLLLILKDKCKEYGHIIILENTDSFVARKNDISTLISIKGNEIILSTIDRSDLKFDVTTDKYEIEDKLWVSQLDNKLDF